MKSVAIIANGEILDAELTRNELKDIDIIIAVDGGVRTCKSADIHPHYIIGDLDSISDELLESFTESQIIHITDQDTTDMEKALGFVQNLHPKRIKVLSALGKRLDHSIANLLVLSRFNDKIPIEMFDNYGKLSFLSPGKYQLNIQEETTVSFFSLGPISNFSLKGFQYLLSNIDNAHYFIGVSNVVKNNPCFIEFDSGKLFMYEVFGNVRS